MQLIDKKNFEISLFSTDLNTFLPVEINDSIIQDTPEFYPGVKIYSMKNLAEDNIVVKIDFKKNTKSINKNTLG